MNYLRGHEFAEVLEREPQARIYRLGKLAHLFHLTETETRSLVPNTRWPLPVLVPGQGAAILDNQLVLGKVVRTTPVSLDDEIKAALGWETRHRRASDNSFLAKWSGEISVAVVSHVTGNPFLEIWNHLSEWRLKGSLAPLGVCFLKPPYPGLPWMPQIEFECIAPSEVREVDLMERTMADPLSLDSSGLCALRSTWWHYEMRKILGAAPFRAPFDGFFIGSGSVPNLCHPTTIALLRCLAAVRWHQLKRTRLPADIGKAEDQLKLVADNLEYGGLQTMLDELWAIAKKYNFIDFKEPPPLSAADYIPIAKSGASLN